MRTKKSYFYIIYSVVFMLAISINSNGQMIDSVKMKLNEYVEATTNSDKELIANQIMEMNYGVTIEEGVRLRNELEARALKEKDPMQRVLYSMVLGDVFYYKNELDSSFYYYLKQAQIAEDISAHQAALAGYINAAYISEIEGKFIEAKELIKRAEKVAKTPNEELKMGNGYFNLAVIFHKMGQPDSASYYIKKVIELDRASENLSGMVHNLQFLVDLELRSGRLNDARAYCNECLEMSRKADYRRGEGMCHYSMAYVEYQDKKMTIALENIDEALNIYLERKDSTKMGQLLRLKANITSNIDPVNSEKLYREALTYGKLSGNSLQLCKTGIDFARYFMDRNRLSDCDRMIEQVKDWSSGKNYQDVEEELLNLRYDMAKKTGNLTMANQILEEKDAFKQTKIEELVESQSSSANQYYEVFEMERELQEISHQNEINQLEARRKNNIYMSIGGILLLTTMLGYFAFQNQKNRNLVLQKTSEEEKLISNNRILEKELDALRSQMNPHFLFNSLNSINDYIMHQEPRVASKYLTKFSKLMRTILNNSKKKFVTIHEELESISLYMEMEQLRFSGKFDYELHVDPEIDKDALMIPAMLIQPYLENSVKHGIKHLQDKKGKINVNIYQIENNRIKIQIKDNGVGRKKSQEIKHAFDRNRKSYGLEITSDRVNILNQIYGVEADLKYIDHEEPSGTEVILSLMPIKNKKSEWIESEQL